MDNGTGIIHAYLPVYILGKTGPKDTCITGTKQKCCKVLMDITPTTEMKRNRTVPGTIACVIFSFQLLVHRALQISLFTGIQSPNWTFQQGLVLSWRIIGRPPHGVSRQWALVVHYGMRHMRQALACQADFWRQLGSPAQQQQQGAGSNHQPFWLQMNCEAQMKMPLLP